MHNDRYVRFLLYTLTGSAGLLQAQVMIVEMRINIFGPEKCSTSLWSATSEQKIFCDGLKSFSISIRFIDIVDTAPPQSFI